MLTKNRTDYVNVIVKYPVYSSYGNIKYKKITFKTPMSSVDYHNLIENNLKYGNFDNCQRPSIANYSIWELIKKTDVLRNSILEKYTTEYIKNNIIIETETIDNTIKYVINDPENNIRNTWMMV